MRTFFTTVALFFSATFVAVSGAPLAAKDTALAARGTEFTVPYYIQQAHDSCEGIFGQLGMRFIVISHPTDCLCMFLIDTAIAVKESIDFGLVNSLIFNLGGAFNELGGFVGQFRGFEDHGFYGGFTDAQIAEAYAELILVMRSTSFCREAY